MTATLTQRAIRTLSWTGVGLATALALPFLVHALPNPGPVPWGAQLLPIFFAGVVLVVRGAPLSALLVAAAAPALNQAVTGMPAGPMLPLLTVELLVFTSVLVLARAFAPRVLPYLGPVAYLLAALGARAILSLGISVNTFERIVTHAWPGLLLLLAVGAIAHRVARQEPRG
jgi:hypothetical protein